MDIIVCLFQALAFFPKKIEQGSEDDKKFVPKIVAFYRLSITTYLQGESNMENL